MGWIAIIKTVLELLPAVIGAIKAIEMLFPESGKGAEKIALVRELVEDTNAEAKENWPLVEKIINRLVQFCNAMGIFQTTDKKE